MHRGDPDDRTTGLDHVSISPKRPSAGVVDQAPQAADVQDRRLPSWLGGPSTRHSGQSPEVRRQWEQRQPLGGAGPTHEASAEGQADSTAVHLFATLSEAQKRAGKGGHPPPPPPSHGRPQATSPLTGFTMQDPNDGREEAPGVSRGAGGGAEDASMRSELRHLWSEHHVREVPSRTRELEAENQRLQQEIEALKRTNCLKVDRLKKQLKAAEEAAAQGADLSDLRSQVEAFRTLTEGLQQKLADCKEAEERNEQRINDLLTERSEMEGSAHKVGSLLQERMMLEQETKRLRERVAELEGEVDRAHADKRLLDDESALRLQNLKEELEIAGHVDRKLAQDALEAVQSRVAEMEAVAAEAQRRAEEAKKEAGAERERRESAEKAAAEAEKRVDAEREKRGEVEKYALSLDDTLAIVKRRCDKHLQEMEALEERNAKLLQRVAECDAANAAEVEGMESEMQVARARVAELEHLAAEAGQRASDAETRAREAEEARDVVDARLKKELARSNELEEMLEKHAKEVVQREAEVTEGRGRVEELEGEVARLSRTVSQAEARAEQAEGILREAQSKINASTEELARLERELAAATHRIRKLEQAEEEATARAVAAEGKATQADIIATDAFARATELEEEKTRVAEEKEALQAALEVSKEREGKLAQIVDESRGALQEAADMQDKFEETEKANAALQSTLSFREAELDAANALNEELAAERDKLQALLDTATERADDSIIRLTELEKELQRQGESADSRAQLLAELTESKRLNEDLMRELASTRQKLDHVNAHTRKTVKEMVDKSEAMEQLAGKAIKEAKQAKDEKNKAAEAVRLCKAKLDEATATVKKLEDEKAQLRKDEKKKTEAHRKALEELAKQVEHREQQLAEAMEKMQAFQVESTKLCDELEKANASLARAKEEAARNEEVAADLRKRLETSASAPSQSSAQVDQQTLRLQEMVSLLLQRERERQARPSPPPESKAESPSGDSPPPPPPSDAHALRIQGLEGELAEAKRELASAHQDLQEETERNERLEARLLKCMDQLRALDAQSQTNMTQALEEVESARAERDRLLQEKEAMAAMLQGLQEERQAVARERRDVTSKLEQFGWVLGQRGALVRELHKLHRFIGAVIIPGDLTPPTKKLAQRAQQQSNHILTTYLSEVEKQHLGIATVSFTVPSLDTGTVPHQPTEPSPRQLRRMLEHSPLTQPPRSVRESQVSSQSPPRRMSASSASSTGTARQPDFDALPSPYPTQQH